VFLNKKIQILHFFILNIFKDNKFHNLGLVSSSKDDEQVVEICTKLLEKYPIDWAEFWMEIGPDKHTE